MKNTYLGSGDGASWLDLIDQVMFSLTLDFLQRCAIPLEGVVVDLGCGVGNMSREWARIVGARGRVIGIDINQDSLKIARERAQAQGLSNISFICADMTDPSFTLPETVSIVYDRLALMHVADPGAVITRILPSLASGGFWLSENSIVGTARGVGIQPIMDRVHKLTIEHGRLYGKDYRLGARLEQLFSEHMTVKLAYVGTTDKHIDALRQSYITVLDYMREALISHNLTTQEELVSLQADLAQATLESGEWTHMAHVLAQKKP